MVKLVVPVVASALSRILDKSAKASPEFDYAGRWLPPQGHAERSDDLLRAYPGRPRADPTATMIKVESGSLARKSPRYHPLESRTDHTAQH